MKKFLLILLVAKSYVLCAQQPDLAQHLSLDFPEKAVAFQNLQTVCVGDSNLLEILAAQPNGIDTADTFIQKILTAAENMNGCAGNLVTSQNPICPNDFVTMTGTQTLGVTPVTYLWYNGSTAQSQTLSFNTQTNIWVQGTGGDGCAWFADGTIFMLSGGITPTISGNLAFCSGGSTTLTASGTGTFSWTGPNGFVSNLATITVNQPGLYTATVSNGGGCNGTASVNVTMNPAPTPTISGPAGFCPGTSATLTASSSVPGSNFSWSTGQSGPSITTSVGGTYTVTASASGGCSGTATKTVTAFPAPSPKIKVSYANNIATLSVLPGLNAVWSTGASTSSITNVPNGTYAVTVTDQQTGCVAASTPVELDLAPCAPPCPLPIANFTFSMNGPLVTFTNTSSNANSYMWTFGDNTTSMADSPTHAYQPGTWTVTLTATNACGSSTFTQTLSIACPPPVANFTFATNGATAIFTNTSTGNGLSYLWDFGDNQTSMLQDPTHTYAMAGDYTVTLKVTNSCGTVSQVSKVISVFFCGPLDAQFNLPVSGGLTLQFTNTSTGNGLSYLWTFGDGGTSTDEDPVHTYAHSGMFDVKLKIFDMCGNEDQITKVLTVLDAPTPVSEPTVEERGPLPYPNPTTGQFWLDGIPGTYWITDPTGRTKKIVKQ